MPCVLDDVGVGVFFVSLPLQGRPDFYKNELAGVMASYKQSVLDHFGARNQQTGEGAEFMEMYTPRAYYLFGHFDLALIALIDDHEFSSRVFRPFSHHSTTGNKSYFENYAYKVITGPTPRFGQSGMERARATFLARDRWPLVGIATLKLNNALLLGGATAALRAVVQHSRRLAHGTPVEVVILESYSWHELTILVFANGYDHIGNYVLSLRESSVGDLLRSLKQARDSGPLRDLTATSSLLKWYSENRPAHVEAAHLFAHTETALGFDFNLLDDGANPLWNRIDKHDQIRLLSRWFVKPGHLREVRRRLDPAKGGSTFVSIGRGDLWFPSSHFEAPAPPAADNTLSTLRAYVRDNVTASVKSDVLRRYTLTAVRREEVPGSVSDAHIYFAGELRELRFTVPELKELRDALRRLGAPKIQSLKLLNMFSNFNDGILDRTLFASFFELRPFLEQVLKTLRERAESPQNNSGVDLCLDLQKWTDNFERAYRNRFHNSERMGEITDFNMEFKGGIQQLVTALNSAYQALSLVLGRPESFVHVGGEPGVYSTEYELRLNYFHTFQPEVFLAIAGHEAGNWHLAGRPYWHPETVWLIAGHNQSAKHVRRVERRIRADIAAAMRGSSPNEIALIRKIVARRFLQNCLSDMLALVLCYNDDRRLYAYWYLAYYMQAPVAYAGPSTLSLAELFRYVLRLLLVTGEDRWTEVEAWFGDFGDHELVSLVRPYQHALLRAARRLRKSAIVGVWLSQARLSAEDLKIEVYESAEFMERGRKRALDRATQRVRSSAERVRRQIAKGEVPRYSGNDLWGPFRFCQSVQYGYLLLLMRKFNHGCSRLHRTPAGAPDVREDGAEILFDPTGGVFTHDPASRRRLFRYRSVVTMSYWDLGMRMKESPLKRMLEGAPARGQRSEPTTLVGNA